MGLGHVPPGSFRLLGACRHVQGRQHRGAPGEGVLAIPAQGRLQVRGRAGEELAARWYEAQGYAVAARNWRCREGELDLVLLRSKTLVFCEVKARSSNTYGAPFEAVTAAKQARIRRLALRWLAARGRSLGAARPADLRFDVASVRGDSVEVIEGAF